MDQNSLIQKAYTILNKSTPLKKDCGQLCNKSCCQGVEQNLGMYLFPGEEKIQAASIDLVLQLVNLGGILIYLALCNGVCDRMNRPLACRIFPLTPYLTKKGILIIIMDPRANQVCPLARNLKRSELDPEFVDNVRKSCQLLIQNEAIKEYIEISSRMLDEMTEKFF